MSTSFVLANASGYHITKVVEEVKSKMQVQVETAITGAIRRDRHSPRPVGEMSQAGVRMIGLGALGYDARPDYHKPTAKECQKAGMDILVLSLIHI